MADMHARHLLRLAFRARDEHPTPEAIHAARRLGRAFGWRRVGLRLRSLAACAFSWRPAGLRIAVASSGWATPMRVKTLSRMRCGRMRLRSYALRWSRNVARKPTIQKKSWPRQGSLCRVSTGLAGDRYRDFPVQFRRKRRAYAGSWRTRKKYGCLLRGPPDADAIPLTAVRGPKRNDGLLAEERSLLSPSPAPLPKRP